MAGNTTIRGRTLVGGQAQAGVRVLALDPGLVECVASTESDAAGDYALDLSGTFDTSVLLARFRGPAFGAVHRCIGNGAAEHVDLALDKAFALELELVGDVPDTVRVTLLPNAVPGWSEPAASTWTYRLDGDRNEIFATWSVTGPTAQLGMQAGTWRLSAWQRAGRVREAMSAPRSWYVSRAEIIDGAELEVAATGIVLEVSEPLRVRLHMSMMVQQ